ncbi:MAG: transglutaminase domain-containing protein [Nitrospirae bacterium]|nr:transglutaminase domain-containing protein [Nitrospirota bacterium]
MVISGRKLFHAAIVLFWIAVMALLIYRHAPIKGMGIAAHTVLPESAQRWMGAYLKGQKIGYTSSSLYRDVDGYSAYEEIHLRLNVLGTEQDIRTKTYVSISPELKVRSFRFSMNSGKGIEIKGKFTGKTLNLDIETAGNKTAQTMELAEEPQMSLTILPYLIKEGFKSGASFKFPVFDPATMGIQDMLIEIAGREKITISGKEVTAFKIRGDLQGIRLLMWVDENGNELREESPIGFTLISESKEEATRAVINAPDIIQQASVPFNLTLPPRVSYLKIRLRGIDYKGLELTAGGQTLNGNILNIVKEDISSLKPAALPVSGMEPFLTATPLIQSEDPRIIKLAREIAGSEKNSLKAARLLYEWVFNNIEKTPSITIPSAVDVLNAKKGDCNELTTIYVALARAIGLPSKMLIGIVYRQGAFYYHAWPEVFVGKWIAIDPTLGEFPVDAKYIRLISGDPGKQLVIARVINNISLEGIEYR